MSASAESSKFQVNTTFTHLILSGLVQDIPNLVWEAFSFVNLTELRPGEPTALGLEFDYWDVPDTYSGAYHIYMLAHMLSGSLIVRLRESASSDMTAAVIAP